MNQVTIRQLRLWEEVVGVLLDYEVFEGGVVVNVSGNKRLLMGFPAEWLKEIEHLRGLRVGILKVDNGRGYRVRVEHRQRSANLINERR